MHSLQASELIPSGFVVENLANDAECVVVAITASTASLWPAAISEIKAPKDWPATTTFYASCMGMK